MNKNSLYKGQHVLVVGAGLSGMAACMLLRREGCHVCLTDGRARQLQNQSDLDWLDENDIVQEFGCHHEATFLLSDLIVVSPGVPLTLAPLQAALAKGIPVIGELELGALYFKGKIIAVTGTNGKTTVTSMLAECLQKSGQSVFVGGNIGTPLCTHVVEDVQAEVAVLEVSSFQLDTICDFQPQVALLLNISPDHLDRYESYGAYAESKMRLFKNQTKEDVAIICASDPEIMARQDAILAYLVTFDNDNWQVDVGNNSLTWTRNDKSCETYMLHNLQLVRPNVQNCMAAISGARFMGAGVGDVQEMLDTFNIPDHRLTMVGEFGGIDFIDDSKATNVGAVRSALAGMTRPVVLIAGGRDKGGDYGLLANEIERIVKGVVLIGEAALLMQKAFAGLTGVVLASSMDEAVGLAVGLASKGDVVLLSPACASFDMFAGYAERGNKFKQAVGTWMGASGKDQGSPPVKIHAAVGVA